MSGRTRRIPCLPPEAWSGEVAAFLGAQAFPGMTPTRGDFNSPRMLAHNLPLAEAWLAYNTTVAHGITLPARLREIAVLRTAWRLGCGYEWLHHVLGASHNGLDADHVAAIQGQGDPSVWTPLEAAIVDLADGFGEGREIDDAVFRRLAEHLDHAQILELMFVTGSYRMLCWIENSAGVPLDEGMHRAAIAQGLPLVPE